MEGFIMTGYPLKVGIKLKMLRRGEKSTINMKIVVMGYGFGGVEVASELRKRSKDLDISMIDRRTRLEYQAAHPEILSGKVTAEEISCDLNKFASRINAEFINEAVVNMDFEAKTVKTKEEREIAYDFLVFSIGAEQTFFGIPGEEERSYSVNTLKGAIETKNVLNHCISFFHSKKYLFTKCFVFF